MNRILVIGATGNVGRHVVGQLAAGAPHSRDDAGSGLGRLSSHVAVVCGDLTWPAILIAAWRTLIRCSWVLVAPPAAIAGALERIARHARRIVHLTAPRKTAHPFFDRAQGRQTAAERLERLIESGMEWTFVRAGMFAGNARHFWDRRFASAPGPLAIPALSDGARTDERDVAAVVGHALCAEGHAGAEVRRDRAAVADAGRADRPSATRLADCCGLKRCRRTRRARSCCRFWGHRRWSTCCSRRGRPPRRPAGVCELHVERISPVPVSAVS